MRRMSGWTRIGSAAAPGSAGPAERAALAALAGIGRGILVGHLRLAEPWTATPSRASFIMVNMARSPLSASPTSQPVAPS
jgi:hypothetical protein